METTFFGCKFGIEGKVVMLGLQFDHGSTSYPGCHGAPRELRALTSGYDLSKGFIWDKKYRQKILTNLLISDMGDIPYAASKSRDEYFSEVMNYSEALVNQQKIPFSIGGDHLISFPLISGFSNALSKKFQIVQIDAHTDYDTFDPKKLLTHATFMGGIHNIKNVEKIIQIGVRGFSPDEELLGNKIINCSIDNLYEELIPEMPIYFTIDTDGFDPSIMGAVSFPEPNGLYLNDLSSILKIFTAKRCNIEAIDWTEYNPTYEQKNLITGYNISLGMILILQHLQDQIAGNTSNEI
jgi:agmatinase